MEQEEQAIPPEAFIAFVTEAENLASELDERKRQEISRQVIEDYDLDKESMSEWFGRMEKALDLARMVKKDKSYPFPNAANIKYPLITSAALQFNARAYPAIVASQGLVKAKVYGSDPQGQKAARGERVAAHMSYQLLNEVEEWEEDTDTLLMLLPIVGTVVRKWWYDPVQERPRCRLVRPGNFIVNSEVQNLYDAPRCSEKLPLYPSEIQTRIASGQFVDFDWIEGEDKEGAEEFIEQHCRLDLDEDGYAEPYIATVHKETETLVKLVADFSPDDVSFDTQEVQSIVMDAVPAQDAFGQPIMVQAPRPVMQEVVTGILQIRRGSYYSAYHFMPSIDGGFWGTGLGLLLGDISESINTIINMMLDAGHMASLGGGFIGSGMRLKGGAQRFRPGEWKMPGETGGVIRDSIVPLTFPGPDGTLFNLLGLLIEAGREISSTKDVMTGDGASVGKNASPTTTLALIEQGMMVFSAAYKRIFRGLKREYKLLGSINAQTLDPQKYNAFHDEVDAEGQPVMFDPAQEYASVGMDIQPVADPNSVTRMQEMAKADLVLNLASQGLVNPAAAAQRVLEAGSIDNTEELVPQPDPMQEQIAQFQAEMSVQMMQADYAQKMADIEDTMADIEKKKTEAIKNMAEVDADAERIRLEKIQMMLKDTRDGMAQSLKAGLARLADQSRDRSDARRAFVDLAKAEARNVERLSRGRTMAGSGTPGAS